MHQAFTAMKYKDLGWNNMESSIREAKNITKLNTILKSFDVRSRLVKLSKPWKVLRTIEIKHDDEEAPLNFPFGMHQDFTAMKCKDLGWNNMESSIREAKDITKLNTISRLDQNLTHVQCEIE